VAQLKTLRDERAQVRALLPAAALPKVNVGAPSEDADELLLQADALRDTEDKVREQLKVVEGRLAEAREERALERRMDTFLGNESIMDEQTHDLRISRTSGGVSAVAAPAGGAAMAAGPASVGAPAPVSSGPSGAAVPRTVQAEDVRPQTQTPAAFGGPLPTDVASLEARRRELKALHEQLERQIQAVEAKARSVRN
jgi:hypothetical protein